MVSLEPLEIRFHITGPPPRSLLTTSIIVTLLLAVLYSLYPASRHRTRKEEPACRRYTYTNLTLRDTIMLNWNHSYFVGECSFCQFQRLSWDTLIRRWQNQSWETKHAITIVVDFVFLCRKKWSEPCGKQSCLVVRQGRAGRNFKRIHSGPSDEPHYLLLRMQSQTYRLW